MARTDNDTWDLASSVGATATMVATQRALASREKLIDDPFAEPLVRAVGVDFFTRLVDGKVDLADVDPEFNMRRAAEGMAVRTRFFDRLFTDAAAAGVRQAVILASGLDARAYRLPWPTGTVVYEIDQPDVIEFKTKTLAGLGAEPTAERRSVAIDLRDDWPKALLDSGFDRTQPTGKSGGHRARARRCRLLRRAVATHFGTSEALRARHRDGRPGLPRRAQPRHRIPGIPRLGRLDADDGGGLRSQRL